MDDKDKYLQDLRRIHREQVYAREQQAGLDALAAQNAPQINPSSSNGASVNNDTVGNGFFGHLKDSADAGFFGSLAGTARFVGEFSPFGGDWANSLGDYFDEKVKQNTPMDALTGTDWFASAIGNAIGSGAAGMLEGAVLLGAGSAMGTALVPAGTAATIYKAMRQVPAIGQLVKATHKMWKSNFGKMQLAEVAGSPIEATAEAGNLITEMRNEGYTDDEIRSAAIQSAKYNTGWLTVANMVGGRINNAIGSEGIKAGLKGAVKAAAKGAATEGVGEAVQEYGQSYIHDTSKGVEFNREDAEESALQALVGSAVLGGIGNVAKPYINNTNTPKATTAKAETEAALVVNQEAQKARNVLIDQRETLSEDDPEYGRLTDLLNNGSDDEIIKEANAIVNGTKTVEEPAAEEAEPVVEEPITEEPVGDVVDTSNSEPPVSTQDETGGKQEDGENNVPPQGQTIESPETTSDNGKSQENGATPPKTKQNSKAKKPAKPVEPTKPTEPSKAKFPKKMGNFVKQKDSDDASGKVKYTKDGKPIKDGGTGYVWEVETDKDGKYIAALLRWEDGDYVLENSYTDIESIEEVERIIGEEEYDELAKPEKPAKAKKPAKPAEPAKPAKNTEPAKLAKPAKQVEPAEPVKPELAKPVKPVAPSEPVKAEPPKVDEWGYKETLGDYTLDRNDRVKGDRHPYKSKDGKKSKIIRKNDDGSYSVETITRDKNGDGVSRFAAFDTLADAEDFVATSKKPADYQKRTWWAWATDKDGASKIIRGNTETIKEFKEYVKKSGYELNFASTPETFNQKLEEYQNKPDKPSKPAEPSKPSKPDKDAAPKTRDETIGANTKKPDKQKKTRVNYTSEELEEIRKYDSNGKLLAGEAINAEKDGEMTKQFASLVKKVFNADVIFDPEEVVKRTTIYGQDGKEIMPSQYIALDGKLVNRFGSYAVNGVSNEENGNLWIYIDWNNAGFRTSATIHEFVHIWWYLIGSKNPKLVAAGKKLIMKTQTWKDVGRRYGFGEDEPRRIEETLAQLSDAYFQNALSNLEGQGVNGDLLHKLKAWFKKFWQTVKKYLQSEDERLEKMSLEELVNMPLADLFSKAEKIEKVERLEKTEKEKAENIIAEKNKEGIPVLDALNASESYDAYVEKQDKTAKSTLTKPEIKDKIIEICLGKPVLLHNFMGTKNRFRVKYFDEKGRLRNEEISSAEHSAIMYLAEIKSKPYVKQSDIAAEVARRADEIRKDTDYQDFAQSRPVRVLGFMKSIDKNARIVAISDALDNSDPNIDGDNIPTIAEDVREVVIKDLASGTEDAFEQYYDNNLQWLDDEFGEAEADQIRKIITGYYEFLKDKYETETGGIMELRSGMNGRPLESYAENNESFTQEMLTPENEALFVETLKDSLVTDKVTKVKDGVWVAQLANGNNLWVDLTSSQAAILGKMSDVEKKRLLSTGDIDGGYFVLRGLYNQEVKGSKFIDIIRLTEAAESNTLDHEVMHFVANTLLSVRERDHLFKYHKYQLKKSMGEKAYNSLGKELQNGRAEERLSDDYAAFVKEDRRPKNTAEKIYWKIKKFLAKWLDNFGIHTPMGMYVKVREGEAFRRKVEQKAPAVGIHNGYYGTKIKVNDLEGQASIGVVHNSPNNFDGFEGWENYVGKGEGAQAHGVGIYFMHDTPEQRELGKKRYRKRLIRSVEKIVFANGMEVFGAKQDPKLKDLLKRTIDKVYSTLPDTIMRDRHYNMNEALDDILSELYAGGNKKGTIELLMDELNSAQDEYEQLLKQKDTLENLKTIEDKFNYVLGLYRDPIEVARRFGETNYVESEMRRINQRLSSGRNILAAIKADIEIIKSLPDFESKSTADEGTSLAAEIPDLVAGDYIVEWERFENQKSSVQQKIMNLVRGEGLNYLLEAKETTDEMPFDGMDGKEIYRRIVTAVERRGIGREKPALVTSKLLNKYGITGIYYNGETDGLCFVMFNDKDVSNITRYSVQPVSSGIEELRSGNIGTANNSKTSLRERGRDAVVTKKPKSFWEEVKSEGFLKATWKEFYRDWVDKNNSINDIDLAVSNALGRELSDEERIYDKVQMVASRSSGLATSLISGSAQHIKALNSTMNNVPMRYTVTLKQVLDEVNAKKMDKAAPEYLKENGFENWVEAFGAYLGWRRLSEMIKTHNEAFKEEYKKWVEGGKKGKEPVFKPYKTPNDLTSAELQYLIGSAPKEFDKAARMYYMLNDNILSIMEDAGLIDNKTHELLNTKYKEYCPLMRDFSDTAAADTFIEGITNGGTGVANVSSMLKRISLEGSDRAVINPLESTIKTITVLANRAERNKAGQHLVRMMRNAELEGYIEKLGPNVSADAKNCIFTIMFNGKKVAYKVAQEFYTPIVGYPQSTGSLLLALPRTVASCLRTGATISPSFIVRNLFRDTVFAGISSKNGFIPIVDTIRGARELSNNKEFRALFEASGVVAFNQYGDAEAVYNSLQDLNDGNDFSIYKPKDILIGVFKAGFKGKFKSAFKLLANSLEQLSSYVESATRAGEFKRALDNGKSVGEAARNARELTSDFSRSGIVGREVNRYVPFFNACIQGGDKMTRLLINDPVRTSAMLATYIILPSVALWALNHDEDWYEELEPSIKYTNWCLPNGIRIPKPQEAGVLFGSGIEAMLDQAYNNDPKAMKNWISEVGDVITPNIIPTIALPLIEWLTNYSFFKGRDLVPQRLQRMPDELQYSSGTSEVSKFVGKHTYTSPIKIDNLVRGYIGTMGMFVWQSADWFAAEKQNLPAKKLSEMQFIRDFNITAANRTRYINDFYELQQKANQQQAGYGLKGKPSAAVKVIRKAGQTISELNKQIRVIETSDKYTPQRKRELIDAKKERINKTAKLVVDRYGKDFL